MREREEASVRSWSGAGGRLRDHGPYRDLKSKSDEGCSKTFSFCETWLKHLLSCRGPDGNRILFLSNCFVTSLSLQGGSILLIFSFFEVLI